MKMISTSVNDKQAIYIYTQQHNESTWYFLYLKGNESKKSITALLTGTKSKIYTQQFFIQFIILFVKNWHLKSWRHDCESGHFVPISLYQWCHEQDWNMWRKHKKKSHKQTFFCSSLVKSEQRWLRFKQKYPSFVLTLITKWSLQTETFTHLLCFQTNFYLRFTFPSNKIYYQYIIITRYCFIIFLYQFQ